MSLEKSVERFYNDVTIKLCKEIDDKDATIASLREEVERLNKALSDTEHIRQYWMGEHGKRVDKIAALTKERDALREKVDKVREWYDLNDQRMGYYIEWDKLHNILKD